MLHTPAALGHNAGPTVCSAARNSGGFALTRFGLVALSLSAVGCRPQSTDTIPLVDSSSDSQAQIDTAFDDGRNWPGEEWEEADPETVGVAGNPYK